MTDEHWISVAIECSRLSPPAPDHYAVGAVVVGGASAFPAFPAFPGGASVSPADAAASPGGASVSFADGRVLATGFTGETDPHYHAEEAALAKLPGVDLTGATLYSSLEPCTTRRSRPRSCAGLIVDAGIRRVVFALREPPVFADGRGIEQLLAAGVEVIELPAYGHLVAEINDHVLGRTSVVS